MKLNQLTPPKGSTKRRKIVGRGIGSGHGKTSTKGHKGQKARSGGGIPAWFEGGQMPLTRRIPKQGFTNIFKKKVCIVNLKDLNKFEKGSLITMELLLEKGLVKKNYPLKVLAKGDLTNPLTINANYFSKSAMEKINKIGGKAVII